MNHENLAHKVNAIKNTAEVIAHSLKQKIYEAELKPGQPLVQENIARMFGVSRVPVRDALQILVNVGIAISVPRRGIFVRPLSRKLLEELFAVRKILEGSAIEIVLQDITEELITMLREIVRKQKEALKKRDVKRNMVRNGSPHRYKDIKSYSMLSTKRMPRLPKRSSSKILKVPNKIL
jgi:DNA-binding GntR family transcriptional regulator